MNNKYLIKNTQALYWYHPRLNHIHSLIHNHPYVFLPIEKALNQKWIDVIVNNKLWGQLSSRIGLLQQASDLKIFRILSLRTQKAIISIVITNNEVQKEREK